MEIRKCGNLVRGISYAFAGIFNIFKFINQRIDRQRTFRIYALHIA